MVLTSTSTAVLGNLFNLSLLLYLVGIGLLIVGMRTRFSAEKTVVLSALLLVPIALPFFFAYPFIFLMNWAQLHSAILARLTALSANWLFTLRRNLAHCYHCAAHCQPTLAVVVKLRLDFGRIALIQT